MTLIGTDFGSCLDFDHGEGYCSFAWEDPLYGEEGLTISFDGHCSRRMPIRSGDGIPDFVLISKDRVRLRFDANLAKKLELSELIEIRYLFTESDIRTLKEFVAVW